MKRMEANLPVIEVPEWKTMTIDNITLNTREQAWAQKLTREGRLVVEEMRGGLRLATNSWVGTVCFEQFKVNITPKLAGENLGLVKLLDYINDLNVLERSYGINDLYDEGTGLLDLLALLFAEACEEIVKVGLLSGYVEREGELTAVRGRILADRQVLYRYGRVDRIECRYDDYDTDILENRVIAAVLTMISRRVGHPGVKSKLRRLQAIFQGACSIDGFNAEEARQLIAYNRLNEYYREAHGLAWLLLDAFGIEDIYRPGNTRCFAFLLNMNRLFERFLYSWVSGVLKETPIRVKSQGSHRSIIWNATAGQTYSRVIPDLLLERHDREEKKIAIDAKYKMYDDRKISSGDIYQLFLYAYAFGKDAPDHVPTTLLLYPASSQNKALTELEIKNEPGVVGARIRVLGIHIPSALEEARENSRGPVSERFISLLQGC